MRMSARCNSLLGASSIGFISADVGGVGLGATIDFTGTFSGVSKTTVGSVVSFGNCGAFGCIRVCRLWGAGVISCNCAASACGFPADAALLGAGCGPG